MKFTFTHIEGSRKGTKQELDGPIVTIGRDPASTIPFDPIKDDRVSTKHAQIAEQGGQVTITDLGSRNGTFVNSQRITGPTPLLPGALIQFGEGGPMVTIAFEAAGAAPKAAAPAKKKGGGGLCVVVAGLLVVVGGGIIAAIFALPILMSRIRGGQNQIERVEREVAHVMPSSAPTTAPAASPSSSADQPPVAASPSPAAPAPSPTPSPAAVQRWESPWAKVGVGSVFEQESSMHMTKPMAMDMKSTMRYTLKDKTADEATVTMETIMPNVPVTPMDTKYKLHDEGQATGETKKLDEKDESITVPAGTFACHYVKMESTSSGVKSTSETWMAKDLPVPVKCVVTSEGDSSASQTTIVLTKADKK